MKPQQKYLLWLFAVVVVVGIGWAVWSRPHLIERAMAAEKVPTARPASPVTPAAPVIPPRSRIELPLEQLTKDLPSFGAFQHTGTANGENMTQSADPLTGATIYARGTSGSFDIVAYRMPDTKEGTNAFAGLAVLVSNVMGAQPEQMMRKIPVAFERVYQKPGAHETFELSGFKVSCFWAEGEYHLAIRRS